MANFKCLEKFENFKLKNVFILGGGAFPSSGRECKLEDILKTHVKALRNVAVSIPGIYLEES